MAAVCARPGCGKGTWNGKPGEYCSRNCRSASVGNEAAAGAACVRPGCGKPSWNGSPLEFCSRGCRAAGHLPGLPAPRLPRQLPAPGTTVDEVKFAELQAQFTSKWQGGTAPKIQTIWHVHNDQLLQKHDAYCQSIGNVAVKGSGRNPGNQQRRFHATTLLCNFAGTPCNSSSCFVCSIIQSGFQANRAKVGRFGLGIYSSSTPSKAYGYGNRRAMFVVGVAVGVAEISTSATSLSDGCHSRVVNNADDELVVFEDAAMVPKYLILF